MIHNVIIPNLNNDNCITYLNEAFKKLKACENSNDMWYLLLNNAMNYVAKNIFWFIKNKGQYKIKNRIEEEIIIRSIKCNRRNL